MKRTMAAAFESRVGERVRLSGWVHHQRHLAQLSFLLLRDVSGIAQTIVEEESVRAGAAALLPETVIDIEGDVVAAPQAPGGFELHRPSITVLSEPEASPPFEMRRANLTASLPSLLDHAALSLRHPRIRAPFAISAPSMTGFRSTLDGLGFTEIQTPRIVSTATESGANVFELDYFGRPGLPRPEPAALQADDGRCLRAGA
ncbi:MAG TPA: OB-fold nucleic acid binding domain-containing protein [Egibacteraceae bacterium]|jgi:nondiscriminating aspartyl-tRNA synthetase|nr:OB-fold nucleic acid binding domain-containing protein [Egibacteraceae bacterium]